MCTLTCMLFWMVLFYYYWFNNAFIESNWRFVSVSTVTVNVYCMVFFFKCDIFYYKSMYLCFISFNRVILDLFWMVLISFFITRAIPTYFAIIGSIMISWNQTEGVCVSVCFVLILYKKKIKIEKQFMLGRTVCAIALIVKKNVIVIYDYQWHINTI